MSLLSSRALLASQAALHAHRAGWTHIFPAVKAALTRTRRSPASSSLRPHAGVRRSFTNSSALRQQPDNKPSQRYIATSSADSRAFPTTFSLQVPPITVLSCRCGTAVGARRDGQRMGADTNGPNGTRENSSIPAAGQPKPEAESGSRTPCPLIGLLFMILAVALMILASRDAAKGGQQGTETADDFVTLMPPRPNPLLAENREKEDFYADMLIPPYARLVGKLEEEDKVHVLRASEKRRLTYEAEMLLAELPKKLKAAGLDGRQGSIERDAVPLRMRPKELETRRAEDVPTLWLYVRKKLYIPYGY